MDVSENSGTPVPPNHPWINRVFHDFPFLKVGYTVDGRNTARPGMVKTLYIVG